ncbi:glycoside hydrolase family protein [Bacteroidota bacterium]
MKKTELIIAGLLLVLFVNSFGTNTNDTSNQMQKDQKNIKKPFASRLEWTGIKIEDENYTIWGGSPIMGDDGKVHVFVARWPEKNVDPAWRKKSEIAHYIADTPEGEYLFSDVTVKGSDIEGAWDRYAPHNPEIRKYGDTYVLLYIANTDYKQPPHPKNQSTGMMTSKSPHGPWKKVGKNGLILSPELFPDSWVTKSQNGMVNPTMMKVGDKYHIYFKVRINNNSEFGVAISDSIEGPYKVYDKPITNNKTSIEDASSFEMNNKYYLLTTDNHGENIGIHGGGILWESTDGINFNLEKASIAYDLIPAYYKEYSSENVKKIYGPDPKFERPKILMIDGTPAYFFAPSGWNVEGKDRTVCHILKIRK